MADGWEPPAPAPGISSSHYDAMRLKELQDFARAPPKDTRPSWGKACIPLMESGRLQAPVALRRLFGGFILS